jgi:hypothetical protein
MLICLELWLLGNREAVRMLLLMFVGYLLPGVIVRKAKDVVRPTNALIGPMPFVCLKLPIA